MTNQHKLSTKEQRKANIKQCNSVMQENEKRAYKLFQLRTNEQRTKDQTYSLP